MSCTMKISLGDIGLGNRFPGYSLLKILSGRRRVRLFWHWLQLDHVGRVCTLQALRSFHGRGLQTEDDKPHWIDHEIPDDFVQVHRHPWPCGQQQLAWAFAGLCLSHLDAVAAL